MPRIKRKRLPQNRIREVNLKYKRNINFLDKPLFIPSRTSVSQEEYSDGKGYEIKCPGGLPVAYDIDVLNFLMHRAQFTWKTRVEFKTMRDLLQKLGYSDGKASYDLVERSLDKWSSTKVSFREHTFYIEQGRRTNVRNLSILSRGRGGRNSIIINIDEEFFDWNSHKFSCVFPVRLMAQLKPHAKRVFELLRKNQKNLHGLQPWKIGFDKLMLKIPVLTETPGSKLLWSLQRSADEINRLLPRFGMNYQYMIDRDPTNSANAVVVKLPRTVRSRGDGRRSLGDEYRSWQDDEMGEVRSLGDGSS